MILNDGKEKFQWDRLHIDDLTESSELRKDKEEQQQRWQREKRALRVNVLVTAVYLPQPFYQPEEIRADRKL